MLELLLTGIPSVIWLLYRYYQLARAPVEKIVNDLKIEIPSKATICVDLISENSIVFHWDVELRKSEILSYIILLNDIEIATLNTNSCTLSGLKQGNRYKINVMALNITSGLRCKSEAVFVESLKAPQDGLMFNENPFGDENMKKITDFHASDSLGGTKSITLDLNMEKIKHNHDYGELMNYFIRYKNELNKISDEITLSEANYYREMEKLYEELHQIKREHEHEADSKTKKAISVKDLENRRDKLSFQKSKLADQLKYLESMQDIFNSKLHYFHNKVKKLKERKSQILKYEMKDKIEIEGKILEAKKQIEHDKAIIEQLDEKCKSLSGQKKEAENILDHIKTLSANFNNETIFSKDGTLTVKGQEIIKEILEIRPDWTEEITSEILNSFNIDNNWKSSFKFEIRKFLSLQHSLEMAKASRDPTYQPNKLTEYSASVEFGGFENALFKKSRRPESPALATSVSEDNASNLQIHETQNYYGQLYGREIDTRDALHDLTLPVPGNQVYDNDYNNSGSFRSFSDEKSMHQDILPQNKDLLNNEMFVNEMSPMSSADPGYPLHRGGNFFKRVWTSKISANLRNSLGAHGMNHTMGSNNLPSSSLGLGVGADVNTLPYSMHEQYFNPVVDNSSSGINGQYLSAAPMGLDLSDTASIGSVSAHTGFSNYVNLATSPPNQARSSGPSTLQSQNDYGNLWSNNLLQQNRAINVADTIWSNTNEQKGSRTFNLDLLGSNNGLDEDRKNGDNTSHLL